MGTTTRWPYRAMLAISLRFSGLARVAGIEPTSLDLEASALPLSYTLAFKPVGQSTDRVDQLSRYCLTLQWSAVTRGTAAEKLAG